MPMIDAWRAVVLERYAKFEGRAGRAEFWWFTLANLILFAILFLLAQLSTLLFVVYVVVALALLIPSLAVGARRLHDTNKTAWLLLLQLIPLIGGIILLVFFIIEGDKQTNQYGPVPDRI